MDSPPVPPESLPPLHLRHPTDPWSLLCNRPVWAAGASDWRGTIDDFLAMKERRVLCRVCLSELETHVDRALARIV